MLGDKLSLNEGLNEALMLGLSEGDMLGLNDEDMLGDKLGESDGLKL